MIVYFQASVNEKNGQVFQVVVDGVVATGGNITAPVQNKKLVVHLSPGNHWVNFVYTWTPKTGDLPSSTDIVKLFNVTLTDLRPKFPTYSPTDKPSLKPSRSPSSHPSARPSASPFSRPSRNPSESPTVKPTVSPTLSPTVRSRAS